MGLKNYQEDAQGRHQDDGVPPGPQDDSQRRAARMTRWPVRWAGGQGSREPRSRTGSIPAVEIISSGQGCAGTSLFLSFSYSYAKGLGNDIPGINAQCCCGGLCQV